jgi:hypothetical protein
MEVIEFIHLPISPYASAHSRFAQQQHKAPPSGGALCCQFAGHWQNYRINRHPVRQIRHKVPDVREENQLRLKVRERPNIFFARLQG